jgi:hypothetical protein
MMMGDVTKPENVMFGPVSYLLVWLVKLRALKNINVSLLLPVKK